LACVYKAYNRREGKVLKQNTVNRTGRGAINNKAFASQAIKRFAGQKKLRRTSVTPQNVTYEAKLYLVPFGRL